MHSKHPSCTETPTLHSKHPACTAHPAQKTPEQQTPASGAKSSSTQQEAKPSKLLLRSTKSDYVYRKKPACAANPRICTKHPANQKASQKAFLQRKSLPAEQNACLQSEALPAQQAHCSYSKTAYPAQKKKQSAQQTAT